MGIFAGTAPEDHALRINDLYRMWHEYPKTDRTAWRIGVERWNQIARFQYDGGAYLISFMGSPYEESSPWRMFGLPVQRIADPWVVELYEQPILASTGVTQQLNRYCSVCGHPFITDEDMRILCDRPHFKLETPMPVPDQPRCEMCRGPMVLVEMLSTKLIQCWRCPACGWKMERKI